MLLISHLHIGQNSIQMVQEWQVDTWWHGSNKAFDPSFKHILQRL